MTDTIVLLHGANGAREEMTPLAALLPPPLRPFAPNWLGHGGRPPPGADYSVAALVDDLIATLDREGISRCFLFGYSIGGYLALALARRQPERVRGIATLATRHIWDRESVDHLVHLADPARLTRPGNPRAAELARVHHPTDWQLVNGANRRMFADLGASPPLSDDDLRAIAAPVLVLNGTQDPLVSVDESQALAALFRDLAAGAVRRQRASAARHADRGHRRRDRRLHPRRGGGRTRLVDRRHRPQRLTAPCCARNRRPRSVSSTKPSANRPTTNMPIATGAVVPSNCWPMTSPTSAPPTVEIVPCTEAAVPAMWPTGSIAIALKFDAASANSPIDSAWNRQKLQIDLDPVDGEQGVDAAYGDEAEQRAMRHEPRAEPLDDARVEERGDAHQPGAGGEGSGEDAGRVEGIGEDLLDRVDVADQAAEHHRRGQRIADRACGS